MASTYVPEKVDRSRTDRLEDKVFLLEKKLEDALLAIAALEKTSAKNMFPSIPALSLRCLKQESESCDMIAWNNLSNRLCPVNYFDLSVDYCTVTVKVPGLYQIVATIIGSFSMRNGNHILLQINDSICDKFCIGNVGLGIDICPHKNVTFSAIVQLAANDTVSINVPEHCSVGESYLNMTVLQNYIAL